MSDSKSTEEYWSTYDVQQQDGTWATVAQLLKNARLEGELNCKDCFTKDQELAKRSGDWWITTGLSQGGKKLLGPFATRDLALSVRTYMEMAEAPATYWVEQATLNNQTKEE